MSEKENSAIKIYTSAFCPYCRAAKRLLNEKGLDFEEINLSGDPNFREFLLELTGQRTVPQILINNEPIGGYSELLALEQSGHLDELLSTGTEECLS